MDGDTLELLRMVSHDGRNVAARWATQAGVSRQAASARLRTLGRRGLLLMQGRGAGVRYALATLREVQNSYPRHGLSEDRVWTGLAAPFVAGLPANVRDVWHYGITEMVNNVVDHSGSPWVHVGMRGDALSTQAWVADDGEGIFGRIQRALRLADARDAALELAKGKFTTDPARHSGEGIFFSSKVFDAFHIRSGGLHFAHDEGRVQVQPRRDAGAAPEPATVVFMQLANDSARTMRHVFDEFAAPEEFAFVKTQVPVQLAQNEGEKLISRSQAKRLTLRFERFQTVVLDFAGVHEIGQAFADEVFRVFQAAHPNTALEPIHMTPEVRAMVSRAHALARSG